MRHSVLLVEDESPRPPWWQSLRGVPGVEVLSGSFSAALQNFSLLDSRVIRASEVS